MNGYHYLQVTEEHFEKAVHFPVQSTAALPRTASHEENHDFGNPFDDRVVHEYATSCEPPQNTKMGRDGLEPEAVTSFINNCLHDFVKANCAKSNAIGEIRSILAILGNPNQQV